MNLQWKKKRKRKLLCAHNTWIESKINKNNKIFNEKQPKKESPITNESENEKKKKEKILDDEIKTENVFNKKKNTNEIDKENLIKSKNWINHAEEIKKDLKKIK